MTLSFSGSIEDQHVEIGREKRQRGEGFIIEKAARALTIWGILVIEQLTADFLADCLGVSEVADGDLGGV
ncbi:MAG TPA: hypothetical protein HA348_04935 [Thermoplasmata archaeon]|nr:hypothetical protein [Thermoplasmata archaeon]